MMPPEVDTLGLPDELPLLPLRDFVVFPYMVLPVFLQRERSIAAVEQALAGDRLVLLLAQRDPDTEEPTSDDLHRVGTVAMVMRTVNLPDGRVKALVQGISKAEVQSFVDSPDADAARVKPLLREVDREWSVETEALIRAVRVRIEELLPFKNLPPEVLSITQNVDDPGRLADLVASNLRLRLADAQEILETLDPVLRLQKVDTFLRRELDVTTVQAELHTQTKGEMSRTQREAYLREQMRAIQAELGDSDGRNEEAADYQIKIEEAGLTPDALTESIRQLRRLERMHPDGPEAQVVRNYLDWMVDLPWTKSSPDRVDLDRARSILETDHAHLDRVKDRILEFLGVRKLRNDSRGPILCFAGPPGVGKTSLGRSIARAMGREFVRASLGGVRDEAEVRGHRRTYVAALPGRIVQGLKQAGTNNPVFMLDEIDKLGSDFRGDPSSALLEVLDPEQNDHFSDHYLNVPFDLSKVFFIATANQLDSIPRPLRDRMEVIRLSGYTPEEKVEIARSYLIPRQVEENGLSEDRIEWSEAAVAKVVTEYTTESGVRSLERRIAAVCRKVARRTAEGDEERVKLTSRNVAHYLGSPMIPTDPISREGEVGVANGLAWTETGGERLVIEAAMTPGKGLVLTGQLGDVMKESGHAALTFARSRVGDLGAEEEQLTRHEIHVHVPQGAIPKDGPSAGVTMATAILSLATGVPVRADVAMTGEVTLRGRVLAVGGIREKALAALRSGIGTVIIPASNTSDLREIPRELNRRIRFVPVSHMDEVLEVALQTPPGRVRAPDRAGNRPRTRSQPPATA